MIILLVYYISRYRLRCRCCGSRDQCRSMFVLSAQSNVARSNRSRNTATNSDKKSRYCLFRLRFVAACMGSARMSQCACRTSSLFTYMIQKISQQFMEMCACVYVYVNLWVYVRSFGHLRIFIFIYCRTGVSKMACESFYSVSQWFFLHTPHSVHVYFLWRRNRPRTNRNKQKKRNNNHLTLVPFIDSN